MNKELEDLSDKLVKLKNFLNTSELSNEHRRLLYLQQAAMSSYKAALVARLALP